VKHGVDILLVKGPEAVVSGIVANLDLLRQIAKGGVGKEEEHVLVQAVLAQEVVQLALHAAGFVAKSLELS
jgi:hypothetical protein